MQYFGDYFKIFPQDIYNQAIVIGHFDSSTARQLDSSTGSLTAGSLTAGSMTASQNALSAPRKDHPLFCMRSGKYLLKNIIFI